MKKITLIFPTQGNPIAVKRTLDSTKNVVDEIIIGSVCVFQDDKAVIESYGTEYNIKIIDLPFNFIFKNGFSETLNLLASHATNDVCMYLNVGEIIEKGEDGILSKLDPKYNVYYIDHSQEKHRWWRVFNPKEVVWSGLIHEETVGELRPYHRPLFTFADTDKDTNNPFKAKVYNDLKEMCYWKQLMRIVDEPEALQATSDGWVRFAKENYDVMKERMAKKGIRPKVLEDGDYKRYMMDVYSNEEFEKERFDTNHIIEFQGDKQYLL